MTTAAVGLSWRWKGTHLSSALTVSSQCVLSMLTEFKLLGFIMMRLEAGNCGYRQRAILLKDSGMNKRNRIGVLLKATCRFS